MYNILLVCSGGMSTSLLVTKMEKSAKDQGIEVSIKAIGEADLKNNSENIDILLLGPQVKYILPRIKEKMESKGTIVDVINTVDYGTMNGEKVLNHAISMIQNK
ncbi:PTS sugar transporter subunit IIB [Tissierella sp. MSJ-40]|uniref:PTS sugar transporter subunit IIB n=1 Tax=Tissierella simiarum TaxID=2841534 RepID=A0ABS6E856_9FIRM|nr:PTS sugar transporter subunit IIB [Tissierella simiarum]MBU5439081.1 PTS sugar transporter subunit IIB [Tissierella simiarum]